jgi:hypothetical protein
MATQATFNKIKRSFTISPESAAFLQEARQQSNAGSDSEALDLLLRELMLKRRLAAIEAAYTDYYDAISGDQLQEDSAWAEMAGRSLVTGVDQ